MKPLDHTEAESAVAPESPDTTQMVTVGLTHLSGPLAHGETQQMNFAFGKFADGSRLPDYAPLSSATAKSNKYV